MKPSTHWPVHGARFIRYPTAALLTGIAVALAGCTAGSASAPPSGPGAPATASTSADATAAVPVTSGSAPPAGTEQFTPIVMTVMTPPQWFTGTDGKVHLTYELEVTNAFPVAVTVTRVDTRNADGGGIEQTLAGDQLSAAMSALVPQTEKITQLPPATVGVIWMDIVLDDPAQLPARIQHELTVEMPPGLPVPATITSRGAAADVDTDPPAVLGPPLTGDGWIAVGSCCDGPHRRTIQPIDNGLWVAQRFAIDFNKLNAAGLLADGDPARNESWFTYDQPVLAVADATVTTAIDGLPDQTPDAPNPVGIEDADGNHVILQLTEGRYAFYAHLKPGSVAVTAGDTVSRGQVIGRTGNSGSSTGAHLHFQLMDRPSALQADGRPYVFDRFTVSGRAPTLTELLRLNPATDPVPVDTADAGPRTDELPLSSDVVAFPG